jgi:hypothetical protein
MIKTLTRIKILQIRHKISYIAFTRRITVPELLMAQILKSHDELTKEGSIPLYDPFLSEKITTLDKILFGEDNCSFKMITKVNTVQVSQKGLKIDKELRKITSKTPLLRSDSESHLQSKVRSLFNKNNCRDIFKNAKVKGEHIYEPM